MTSRVVGRQHRQIVEAKLRQDAAARKYFRELLVAADRDAARGVAGGKAPDASYDRTSLVGIRARRVQIHRRGDSFCHPNPLLIPECFHLASRVLNRRYEDPSRTGAVFR